MSEASEKISFRARATAASLHLTVRFDGAEILSRDLTTESLLIEHEFDDTDSVHCLEIEMSGKTRRHTKLDGSGNIIEDHCIEISDIKLSDIDLGHLVTNNAVYEHDTNGTTAPKSERFFGTMGCNGVVRLEFTSPVYIWLLENM